MAVTFPVDDVKDRATAPLPEKPFAGGRAYAPRDLALVSTGEVHPLVEAVHLAFAEHRPLVLSPDAIWTAIAQGFAIHVNANAERLRERFVRHEGKLTLSVEHPSGSIAEEAWPALVGSFGERVRDHVGPGLHKLVLNDFSTTRPHERTVSEIVLMDAFQRYFDYQAMCICGIPEITLLGTPEDWKTIRRRLDVLAEYDLAWWTAELAPAVDRIVATADGTIDRDFWQCIYKPAEAYGGDVVTGWVQLLFPYYEFDSGFVRHEPTRPEPGKKGWFGRTKARSGWIFQGARPESFPRGKSRAPVRVRHADGRPDEWLELLGGFVGVSQDRATLALRPELGWMVREDAAEGVLFALRARSSGAPPARGDRFPEALPGALKRIYDAVTGASLFDGAWRLRDFDAFGHLSMSAPFAHGAVFADLADGRALAFVVREGHWPVVLLPRGAALSPDAPIVADDVLALVERALADGPHYFDAGDAARRRLASILR